MTRLVDTIGPGDKVTIVDRFGKQRTGRAVMRSSYDGWVLNMGGKHGTPGLASDENVTNVKKARGSKKSPYGLGESAYRLSIGERVMTPLGPGKVTAVRGQHIGVQHDDGKFSYQTAGQVQPSGEKQRYLQGEGGMNGLGLAPETHEQRAAYWYGDAQRWAKSAMSASNSRAGNACDVAVNHLANAENSFGRAAAHLDSAGSRDDRAHQKHNQMQKTVDRVLHTVKGKCLRKSR